MIKAGPPKFVALPPAPDGRATLGAGRPVRYEAQAAGTFGNHRRGGAGAADLSNEQLPVGCAARQ